MGLISNICSPALIYLAFSLTQVIIDTYKRAYNIAFVKFIQMIVFTLLLNLLCIRGLTWVSWLIIAIPFLFMGFMTFILLFILKLDNDDTVIIDDNEENTEENIDENVDEKNKSFDIYYWSPPKKYSVNSGEFVS
jgi:amino acid transporter